jgi:transcriptional regulator with XRE-family HTH domain
LHGAVVRARRLELGLSERTLTAMLGTAFSQAVVRSIEAGNASRDLILADIERVAEVLSLSVTDAVVFIKPSAPVRPPAPWVSGVQRRHHDNRAARLGCVLHRLAAPVPEEAVATALSLTMFELEEALDNLYALLAPAGLEVRRTSGFVNLGTGPVGRDFAAAVQALARQQVARNGLNVSQALMMFRAAVSEKYAKTLGNAEQMSKGALLNAGPLEHTPSGGVRATADVMFSLLLP